jgi:PKD repeat protein
MTSRAILRLRGFPFFLAAFLLAAAACGGPSEPNGTVVVTAGADGTIPLEAPYTLAATFTDTTNRSPWSYDVDWGDGNSSSGSKTSVGAITASHAYATQGSYRVRVTVTNDGGKRGSGSFNVAVTDPVLLAAGDIGDCLRQGDDQTAALLDGLVGIVTPLGDNAYLAGSDSEYTNCYAPTWGRQKSRTRPVAGNHDYNTPNATGYFNYFGAAAGDPAKGYYSYTLGTWFVIVLNTGPEKPDSVRAGSTQEQWLRAELASHSQQCVLALFHHPRFSTIKDRSPIQAWLGPIWDALYEYGADLVLNGHDHAYQRFAPQRPDGTADPAFGIRQIAVGTGGGETLYLFADPQPAGSNIQVKDNTTNGVIEVTLKNGGYDWRFIPAATGTFNDSGSATCHGRPT